MLLDRALGGKGSLGDALQNSLANAFAAYGFKLIGDTTHGVLDDGSLGKIGLHALMEVWPPKRSVAISVPEPWLRESTRRWWIASPDNTPACPSMTRRAC
ncbi:hypothetical protein ACG3QZ_23650 [Pseudomonas aeruginosa]|uniref:hypothetical protein n=1 Tax=Pseudomonas aeruginosa TaxID=287 RepID=UPI0037492858